MLDMPMDGDDNMLESERERILQLMSQVEKGGVKSQLTLAMLMHGRGESLLNELNRTHDRLEELELELDGLYAEGYRLSEEYYILEADYKAAKENSDCTPEEIRRKFELFFKMGQIIQEEFDKVESLDRAKEIDKLITELMMREEEITLELSAILSSIDSDSPEA